MNLCSPEENELLPHSEKCWELIILCPCGFLAVGRKNRDYHLGRCCAYGLSKERPLSETNGHEMDVVMSKFDLSLEQF